MSGRPAYLASEPSLWTGCYDGGWQGEIVPEAFAHPAKVSRALIRRIYEHAFAEGWLHAGDVCCDPFGGIAGTAIDAMWNGCHWIGCELEPRFVGLAQQNIDLWQRKYGSKPGFGSARILQGDSRKLSEIIAGADLVCSSPPYADQVIRSREAGNHDPNKQGTMRDGSHSCDAYGQSPGQLGAMKEGQPPTVDLMCSSPPYAAIATGAGGLNTKPGKDGQQSGRNPNAASQDTDQRYGESAGQLAVMREGEAPNVDVVLGSPPYAECELHVGPASCAVGKGSRVDGTSGGRAKGDYARGDSPGQLGSMPEGRFDAVVSSPPYEAGAEGQVKASKFRDPAAFAAGMAARDGKSKNNHASSAEARVAQFERDLQKDYGSTEGNIGNQSGDTFWQAAREIVAQCHAILRPGGHAIWICKNFIRANKVIPFSDQWLALSESLGFELVCRHRAMLVSEYGAQADIFGGEKILKTERKSFFRRLYEKRPGAQKIDWEDILCLIKK